MSKKKSIVFPPSFFCIRKYNKNALLGQSYNQPKISLCSSWNPNATTIVGRGIFNREYGAIFINNEDTMYAVDHENDQILIWQNGSSSPTRNISGDLIDPQSLFITTNGDIYVANGYPNNRVDKWASNATSIQRVISVNSSCTGLFIDMNQRLYCSLMKSHHVVRFELQSASEIWANAAGTGCPGPVSNTLTHPHGIFVDSNFNLYVADTGNDRIQRFEFSQSHGVTVAGFGASTHFILKRPTSIILTADHHLFIVDSHNHRVVRLAEDEFRCVAGCSGTSGDTSNQLNYPHSLAFDTYGNIVVTDLKNRRIQKFNLISDTCSKSISRRSVTFSMIIC